ncbi:MAG: hypothetical protein M1813_004083 [Trichoglossum hirsutum]|nr:MAG: hypothetical protein M1813_004083 [Trichoglossum hirsutum]
MSCGASRSRPIREGKEEEEEKEEEEVFGERREKEEFGSSQAAVAKPAYLVTVHLEEDDELHLFSLHHPLSPFAIAFSQPPPPQQQQQNWSSPQRLLSPLAIKSLHHQPSTGNNSARLVAHSLQQHNAQLSSAAHSYREIESAYANRPPLPWNSVRRQQSAARLWNPVNYLPRDFSPPPQQQQQRSRVNSKTGWQRGHIVGGVGVVHTSPLRTHRDVKGKQPLWQLTSERAAGKHEENTLRGKRDTFGLVTSTMGENADGDGADAVAHNERGDTGDVGAMEQERRRQSADHARRVQQSLRQGDSGAQPPPPAHFRGVTNPTITTDLERGDAHQNAPPPGSRVGMPRDSPRSQPSFQQFYASQPTGTSNQQPQIPTNNGGIPQDEDDDCGWGPSHPCFPHINTHVPLNSPEATTTRIVRIRRDWMLAGDLAPTFSNLYPEILDPYLPEEEFRLLIRRLNDELARAFDPWSFWNMVDATIGVLTLWVWDDLGATVVKRRLRALEQWVREWNERGGKMEGVKVVELRKTGYMSLDIQIPDPHVGMDESEFHGSRPATAMQTIPMIPALTVNGEQEPQQQRPSDHAAPPDR